MHRLVLLTAVLCLAMAGGSFAFHDAGVARCSGCHTMHNSENGTPVDPNSANGNPWLLKDATPSDVCLGCHATSRGAEFSVTVLTPSTEQGAGNFIFLLEDNLNDGRAGSAAIPGDAAGHNLKAPGYGLAPDATLGSAPGAAAGGAAFPASEMGCSSCHDPHGNEHFRLLYGAGASIQDGLYTFTNAAPSAVGLGLNDVEANNLHTAYMGGMSAWCGNCHGDFHSNDVKLIHPSGVTIGGTIATAYNLYNGTSDQTGGNAATAFLAAVPFEDAAMTTTSTEGPTALSQVSCITCHRAHATSAPNAGRWDFNVGGPEADGFTSGSWKIPNPYDVYQRSLCNKCHVKDAGDELVDWTPVP